MKTLIRYFEKQADLHPKNIALICDKSSYSYEEVENQANQIAHLLKAKGIKSGDLVGLLLNRTPNVYIVLLAILKIGAAYVPLDPDYPADRIAYILDDCKISLLITETKLHSKLSSLPCQALILDKEEQTLRSQSTKRLNLDIQPDALCYVIYTSGSTGRPKGVAITHQAACNYVESAITIYDVTTADRVYQGFSVAFDASIEEIWVTLSAGATLIVGTSESVRSGAELVEFLNSHKITVLSTVPTLLAMLEGELPFLKIIILGGEVCQENLIQRWSRPNLRIINTYGPTEATVITTYSECSPNKTVTIGKPIPHCEVIILDENLQAVAPGKPGELCVGGIGLARGYINNVELTEKKFIPHPFKEGERLYRTGDRGCTNLQGEIEYLGRLDDQIKLRGFRIELPEIESVLLEYPDLDIRNVAVTVHELTPNLPVLVAYLLLKEPVEINHELIIQFLHKRLPAYMIPGLFDVVTSFPLLPSGKIDRKSLPKPQKRENKTHKDYVAPRTEIERKIATIWEDLFQHSPISIKADFFHELGGHSLSAAKMVSILRKKISGFEQLSMLDLYENFTIEQLAKKINLTKKIEENAKETKKTSGLRYYLCGVGQALGCLFQFAVHSWEFLLVILTIILLTDRQPLLSWHPFATIGLLFVGLPPLLFALAIGFKWLLLGRIKPGEYPLWGWYYFRWWLVQRIEKIAPANYLIGSPLMNIYCRLMGAKIGKNCHIGTTSINAFDLLTIGNDSSINHNAVLLGYTVENSTLKIGSINIGERCFVGAKAILNINTTLEDDSMLEDLSMLPEQSVIPKGKHYHGSPARPLKTIVKNQLNHPEIFAAVTTKKNINSGILHYLGLFLITFVYYAAYLPGISLLSYFYEKNNIASAIFIGAPAAALSFIVFLCLGIYIVKKILVGTVKPGSYKIRGLRYIAMWVIERLWDTAEMEVLAESLYFPWVLRLFGAKIGKRVEIADLSHLSPDLLIMNDESFSTGGVFMGVPRVHRGYATFAPTTIGKRTFIGNTALLPPGTELGDGCLLGCLTIPPINGDAKKSHTAWLGSPPVFLPRREFVPGFTEEQTYKPPKRLYVIRLLIEFVRIILPSTFAFISLIALFMSFDYLYSKFSLMTTALALPLFDTLIMIAMALIAIALKWILMGRYKETVKPLWSVFIWKSDLLERLYNVFLSRLVFNPLLGTPFIAPFLRLLGTKIGKRVFIDTSIGFAEFDLTDIGNDVALNAECVLQTHLFEDRIFKIGPVKIEDGCSLGAHSEILYNAVMEKNSSLGSLSLLMKGEILPVNSYWAGVPAQYVPQYYSFQSSSINFASKEQITKLA